ncbi:MAG: hypothetical protein ACLQBK_01620 [Candidatus Sulfotelmatobacter sp.]
MTDRINLEEVKSRSRKRARHASRHVGGNTWQSGDAGRFLFGGQCYDAGSGSDTTCGLCGEGIRFNYVLKVIESPSDPYSPQVGKMHIGECCFKSVKAANEKLYLQLLAAAVNLRTYLEAVERDKRIFGPGATPENFDYSKLQLVDEELGRQLFEGLLDEGGDPAN